MSGDGLLLCAKDLNGYNEFQHLDDFRLIEGMRAYDNHPISGKY